MMNCVEERFHGVERLVKFIASCHLQSIHFLALRSTRESYPLVQLLAIFSPHVQSESLESDRISMLRQLGILDLSHGLTRP
jgi:hypothetical protein